ncbi:hypothetical protein F2Q68_00004663 [Brassica cretica]|uniref:Uncharacterized protein n=1 Tax=Brassica cretica TaxID=69181 RepID=A0A8S9JNI9_BRACR|nr:hypothetical protein F2Q68_00004663 [Brassica cretica]
MKTYNQVRNNSEKDSHDRSSTKVTQGLGQWITDSETSIANSPKGRAGPDAPTNSPVRRVASVQLTERASWIEQAVQLARSASWINQPAFVPSS